MTFLGSRLADWHTFSHFIPPLPPWGVCVWGGGNFPILQIRKLRIRITQPEKGDRLELHSIWLQERSLPQGQCWASRCLPCSVTQRKGGREKKTHWVPSLLSSRYHSLIIAPSPPAVLPYHSTQGKRIDSALIHFSPSCPNNTTEGGFAQTTHC